MRTARPANPAPTTTMVWSSSSVRRCRGAPALAGIRTFRFELKYDFPTQKDLLKSLMVTTRLIDRQERPCGV